ncbi:MAG: fructose-1,6-bisphosphatase [candidate division Zixibacteria bacterium]|nr:fructose-1,6-bisphosphatase [candidate division Zixibacteria bacterium]
MGPVISDNITLENYLADAENASPENQSQIAQVVGVVGKILKRIYKSVQRASLAGLTGDTGAINIQGEEVQKLDEFANQTFVDVFKQAGIIGYIISEEMNEVVRLDCREGSENYLLTVDPLDGSSNIDVNVTIGSIFGLYKLDNTDWSDIREALQPGNKLIASGYSLYGSALDFVFWMRGSTVNGFVYDIDGGEFILAYPDIKIPTESRIYSVNAANYEFWDKPTQKVVDYLRTGRKESTTRYVGSLVADFHRSLLKGGVYLYPAHDGAPCGKIRLLYEAAPLAKLITEAGGGATTGREKILDIAPTAPHQRCPTILGSAKVVAEIERIYRENN